MALAYHYDQEFRYHGHSTEAPLHPNSNVPTPIAPRGSTLIPPPDPYEEADTGLGPKHSYFDPNNQVWLLKWNNVGFQYWLPDGTLVTIEDLDVPKPVTYLTEAPEVIPTLEEYKARAVQFIDTLAKGLIGATLDHPRFAPTLTEFNNVDFNYWSLTRVLQSIFPSTVIAASSQAIINHQDNMFAIQETINPNSGDANQVQRAHVDRMAHYSTIFSFMYSLSIKYNQLIDVAIDNTAVDAVLQFAAINWVNEIFATGLLPATYIDPVTENPINDSDTTLNLINFLLDNQDNPTYLWP